MSEPSADMTCGRPDQSPSVPGVDGELVTGVSANVAYNTSDCSNLIRVFFRRPQRTGTPRDALAPYPWSGSVNWCLAEG